MRDFNQSAGKDIALQIGTDLKKGVLDPFTSVAVTKKLFTSRFYFRCSWSNFIQQNICNIKRKKEQNLLRQRLGLTKEQF